jgi:hypothetical protein
MVGIGRAWNQPIRRIYLIWGIVLLIGFTLTAIGFQDGWVHWYPLAMLGIFSQIYKQRLTDNRAKLLLVMWALLSLGGTFYSHQLMVGGFEFPTYFTSFAILWLWIMSIPQIITGFIMKSKFQIGLGVFWIALSIVFKNFLQLDEMTMALITAAVTGLPYLYIALKR